MYINRPVVEGKGPRQRRVSNKEKQSSKSKNIRVKTMPSSHTLQKNLPLKNEKINGSNIEERIRQEVIGHKQVKELLEVQLKELVEGILIQENQVCQQEEQLQRIFLSEKNYTKVQDSAYKQCLIFINDCFSKEQRQQTGKLKKYRIKLFEFEETLQQLQLQKQGTLSKISQLKQALLKQEKDIKLLQKRKNNRTDLEQTIRQERQNISTKQKQLYMFKQESLKQKNAFIQLQAEEVKLNQLIVEVHQDFEKETQNEEHRKCFQQTQTIRDKLKNILKQESLEVKEFLTEKIQSLSKARAKIDELEEHIYLLEEKIEEQTPVINMLVQKCQLAEQQQKEEFSLDWRAYREKYREIFLPQISSGKDQSQDNAWQDYRDYLDKLLQSPQKPQLDQSQSVVDHPCSEKNQPMSSSTKSFDKRGRQPFAKGGEKSTEKGNLKVSLSNSFSCQPKIQQKWRRISKFTEKPLSEEEDKFDRKAGTILPKLIRMEGRVSDQDKIKGQLTKFTQNNIDDDVSLVTVDSNDMGEQDGDIIEVEFKGTGVSKNNFN